jgi:hypothetical protein
MIDHVAKLRLFDEPGGRTFAIHCNCCFVGAGQAPHDDENKQPEKVVQDQTHLRAPNKVQKPDRILNAAADPTTEYFCCLSNRTIGSARPIRGQSMENYQ